MPTIAYHYPANGGKRCERAITHHDCPMGHSYVVLPDGVLRVYVTADYTTPDSAKQGMPADLGWTNYVGSTSLYESRNDVRPVFECHTRQGNLISDSAWAQGDNRHDSAELLSELRHIIKSLGAIESEDGATIYGAEPVFIDYVTGGEWLYAIHAHVKHYAGSGYIETDIDILTLTAGLEDLDDE